MWVYISQCHCKSHNTFLFHSPDSQIAFRNCHTLWFAIYHNCHFLSYNYNFISLMIILLSSWNFRNDAPINGVFLFILIIFHFSITLAVFQSNLCSSQNFPCHEKDTECVFGFALAQNAQIISRLEPITSMFAFPNPGCNSSLSALGCNTTLTSIANTQLNASLSSTVDL